MSQQCQVQNKLVFKCMANNAVSTPGQAGLKQVVLFLLEDMVSCSLIWHQALAPPASTSQVLGL
jgi:hypothetical protein